MQQTARRCVGVAVVLVAVSGGRPADAQGVMAGMVASIGEAANRRAIAGLATRADCTGPRGAFATHMVSHGRSVRFVQARDGVSTELVLLGDAAFSRDDPRATMDEAGGVAASVVRGHDVHRLLLDLEGRLRVVSEDVSSGCVEAIGPDGPVTLCRAADGARPARLTMTLPGAPRATTVTVEFDDWRAIPGATLPFTVRYLQDGQRFTHRFSEILPFALAPGVTLPDDPAVASSRLGDLADLASLHRAALDAHRASDVSLLARGEFDRSAVSRRGSLAETSRDALVARLGPYLGGVRFTRYEDVRVPVIAVSNDGTLGWLMCEVEAEGNALTGDGPGGALAYAYSWVEMSIKSGGRWQRHGNASSARP